MKTILFKFSTLCFALGLLLHRQALSVDFECDLKQYRQVPGISVQCFAGTLTTTWKGERDSQVRLRFGMSAGQPTIQELSVRKKGAHWSTLGHNLSPIFAVTTGIRRTGHDLPEENRWDVFWDAPLQHPEEVKHYAATFQSSSCLVRSSGNRLEISFPGVSLGIFSGRLQFTVYRGSNLIRQEAIVKTEEPSVAYIYSGGLQGFSTRYLPKTVWQDTGGNWQRNEFYGEPNQEPVPVRAKNRILVAAGGTGSLAVFPPPHQFFFARELEINLGYVWYQKQSSSGEEHGFALGVRQHPTEEGYNDVWIKRVYALYNAPPGTWQRMPVYFYADAGSAEETRRAVLAYTHSDKYKKLAGYQTMVTHFHTAFADELTRAGSLDAGAPWIPAMRALGINIAYICDFHGDGHPEDPGPLRFKDQETYYKACQRFSDRDFLILPGEEPNVYLGGHWNILFPKPVYWAHVRGEGKPLVEKHPEYGTVYRTGNAQEVAEMIRRTGAVVWQTHPRTKGSTFYPDKIKSADYFKDDSWLGGTFKAMPVDLSQQRLCELRCFGTMDDMNNWGQRKFLIGEVDTYKKWPSDDLYGHFNVNYLKLDSLPALNNWSEITRALRAGDFFVTTGEILIREFAVNGVSSGRTARVSKGQKIALNAVLEWTFPLEFIEAVWGNGESVDRQIISATDSTAFGNRQFSFSLEAKDQRWIRFAAWDSAGNGAFTQPVYFEFN